MAILLGAGTGLAFILAIDRVGPTAALLPVAGLIAAYLVASPRVTLAALGGLVVVVEGGTVGIPPLGAYAYQSIRFGLTPADVLLGLLAAGTALELYRARQLPRGIGPMTLPLIALAGAFVAGLSTGYVAGAGTDVLTLATIRMAHLVLLPLICVNLLRDARSVRTFIAVAAGLACFKAIAGLLAIPAQAGIELDGATITYYEPLANWLLLLLLLGCVAAWARGVELPGWVQWTGVLSALALLLSYRRSFWIAALFAVLLVLLVASRRRARTTAAIAGVALCAAVVGAFVFGDSSKVQSPVVERVRSLDPASVVSNSSDRYRLDEQRNVLDDLRRHPITGLGMGIPWTARHPLSQEHDRLYVHSILLWYWLKLGLVGLAAFLWLIVTALWCGFRVWREHPDPIVRVSGLAVSGGLIALIIVELTASFTGVDDRQTIGVGLALGWVAAAWHTLPQVARARTTASTE